MAQRAFCSCPFSSHIWLAISASACCLKTQLFFLDPGSDLNSIMCQHRQDRTVLHCRLLMPNLTLPAFSLPLFLPLSHCVLGSLSLPLLPSVRIACSFYCFKGTLPTTHICPFIILHGLFYSCPITVVDADHCLTNA